MRSSKPAILEPVAVFALIMLYIWWLRFHYPATAYLIFAFVVLSHVWRRETPEFLGFAPRNLKVCLAIFAPVLLFLVLGLLTMGAILQTTRVIGFDYGLSSYLAYCIWGLFQQYLLNGYFVNRFLTITASGRKAALLAAAFFATAHFPNWFLMPVTFVAGYYCARIYLKYRNLYFLGLAHGTIGFLLYLVIPDAISHHLAVGPGWFRH